MKIKDNVFGSKKEKKLFHYINNRWSKYFNIYHNLPLSNIVINPDTFLKDDKEIDFFYKTSIDYTICTKDDNPIMSIEYDGIGRGFSRDGVYVRTYTKPIAEGRKKKLDLKLRIAEKLKYPLIVISSEEKQKIDEDIDLIILDGIIGQILSRIEFREMFEKWKGYIVKEANKLSFGTEEEKIDYLHDQVLGLEVAAELKWDPIAKKAAELEDIAWEKGFIKTITYEYGLTDPEISQPDLANRKSIDEYVEKIKNLNKIGCKVTIETPKQTIVQTIWVRNISSDFVGPGAILHNLATLLACKKVLDLYEKTRKPD